MGSAGMRTFLLIREIDHSGISGTGEVAAGCNFSNGKTVLSWKTKVVSIEIFDSMEDMLKIHGYQGDTKVKWLEKS